MAKQFPAVLVTGTRQAGKTSILRHLFAKASYLSALGRKFGDVFKELV